jgi:hypothetical protein
VTRHVQVILREASQDAQHFAVDSVPLRIATFNARTFVEFAAVAAENFSTSSGVTEIPEVADIFEVLLKLC